MKRFNNNPRLIIEPTKTQRYPIYNLIFVFRLSPSTSPLLLDATNQHLADFAAIGLRTLCLAYKDLDNVYFDDWMVIYHIKSCIFLLLRRGNEKQLWTCIIEKRNSMPFMKRLKRVRKLIE